MSVTPRTRRPIPRRRGWAPRSRQPVHEPLPTRTPPLPPDDEARADIESLSGLNIILGIWVVIAPWVIGYSVGNEAARWNDVAVGGLIALLALGRVAGAYRAGWLSLANAALAVWLFIAAFTLDNGGAAMWNDWILGVVIFVVATASAAATGRLVARRRPPTDVRP